MSNIQVDILGQTFFFISCLETAFVCYGRMKPRGIGRIRTWILMAVLIYGCTVLIKNILKADQAAYILLMAGAYLLIMVLLYYDRPKRYFKWLAIQYALAFGVNAVVIILIRLLREVSYAELYDSTEISLTGKMLADIVYMAGIAVIFTVERAVKGKRQERNTVLLLFSIPLYLLTLVFGYFAASIYISKAIVATGYLIVIFGVGIGFTIILVLENMDVRAETQEALDSLGKLREKELEYYNVNIQKMQEAKIFRHELGNQLQMLEMLLETERDREKIKRIIKNIQNKLRGTFRE